MIARVAAVLAIALTTMGAQWSCSSDGTARLIDRDFDSGDGPTFTTTLALRDSADTETSEFDRAELIHFELAVRNRTSDTVRLSYGHPPHFDFVVFDDGTSRVRWRYVDGRAFTPVVMDTVFAPGETKTFTFAWDQVLSDGAMLERGVYEARGVMPFPGYMDNLLAPHELGSVLRRFRVD